MTRQAELEAMDWQAIRDIAEKYDIKKPSTGWKDAIPEILEFEEIMGDELLESQSQVQSQSQAELPLAVENPSEKSPEKPSTETKTSENKPLFATEYYKATGIPFCSECGAPKTTVDGEQICPVGNASCEFIK